MQINGVVKQAGVLGKGKSVGHTGNESGNAPRPAGRIEAENGLPAATRQVRWTVQIAVEKCRYHLLGLVHDAHDSGGAGDPGE